MDAAARTIQGGDNMIEQEKMIVEALPSLYPLQKFEEDAVHAVIDALPHWIPCSEGLPEKEGYFLVTVSCMGVIYVDARFYYVERDSRHWGNYESGSVIAWMTLPAPYQLQKEVTECQIGLRGH